MSPHSRLLALCLAFLMIVAGFGTSAAQSPVSVDGVVAPDEYPGHASFDKDRFSLRWRTDDDTLYLAMEAETEGWVSVGIEPEGRMEGADMLFGWVNDDGTVEAADCYATNDWGEHPPDEELGGAHDILEVAGTEKDGHTLIELSRPLVTGDAYDREVPTEGTLRIIWAFGSRDGYTGRHGAAGLASIDLATGVSESATAPPSWPLHAASTAVAFGCVLAGALIARYAKRKPWWLKRHRILTGIGSIIGIAGAILGWTMVGAAGSGHGSSIHTYLGIVVALLLAAMPTLGILQLKVRAQVGRRLRPVHRWLGRATLVLMALQIALGTTMVLGIL